MGKLVVNELVIASVVALLGGGLLTGAVAAYKARQEAKKYPVDINSITISSAERALIMLKTSLDEAEETIERYKEQIREERLRHKEESAEKDRKIRELEADLRNLEIMFNELSEKLTRVLRTAKEAREVVEGE